MNKDTGQFTGGADAREASRWKTMFEGQAGMFELYQKEATHDGPHSRGRLDRVYVSQPLCDQLDHLMFATPLEWCSPLSQHRPLLFVKRKRKRDQQGGRHADEEVMGCAEWRLRVSTRFQTLVGIHAHGDLGPLERLDILKQAIRSVTDRMVQEKRALYMSVLRRPKDELGCIMGALRAMERTGWIWLAKFAKGSKHMMDRLSQRQVDEQPEETLIVLRRLAVEVARLDVRVDLEELRRDLPCLQQERGE